MARRVSPREVDVAEVVASNRFRLLTHEAAAVLGYESADGFLRAQVRTGLLRPERGVRRPMWFCKAKVLERAGITAV